MKFSTRRFLLIVLLLLPILTGCSETEGPINALKDRIANTRIANHASSLELQQHNQKLSAIKRQMSAEASKRSEFEAKAKKSAATHSVLVKYRIELEGAITNFAASVDNYRTKYAAP